MDKKYSIGLSSDITIKEYEKLLADYHKYIDYVYFSVPISKIFQSREKLYINYSVDEATDFLRNVIDVFKCYHIKIELALNTYKITDNDIRLAYDYLKNTLQRMPDAIVSNYNYMKQIEELFPDIYNIVSFNSFIRNKADLQCIPKNYKEIVLGSSAIRNIQFWKEVKDKGFRCRLLLNNGCSFNCGSCANGNRCLEVFERNLQKNQINYLYALQSLYPSEVKQYISHNPYIYGYKISNRNCSYDYLRECLDGYIKGIDKTEEGVNCFYYWARLGHFSKYKLNLDEEIIRRYKKQIWENNNRR